MADPKCSGCGKPVKPGPDQMKNPEGVWHQECLEDRLDALEMEARRAARRATRKASRT